MSVQDIMSRNEDRRLVTVRPADTAETAATLLATNRIGAMPVRDEDGRVIGMLSERDLVRGLFEHGAQAHALRVRDLMSTDVASCRPGDTLRDVLAVMDRRGIRHLPVIEGGRLVGMLSQRDVVRHHLAQTEMERDVLRDVAIARR